jgi:hypothetical protein
MINNRIQALVVSALVFTALLISVVGCRSDNRPVVDEGLLVDMVTYIGRKPPLATSETRFDPEFREYYTTYAKEFEVVYYHIREDGTHLFYLIRPARSLHGNRRGVGGMFRLEHAQINGFEELFNTPVMEEKRLREIGQELFEEMRQAGNVNRFLENRDYIEWPDERLRYDKEKFEWRYGQ